MTKAFGFATASLQLLQYSTAELFDRNNGDKGCLIATQARYETAAHTANWQLAPKKEGMATLGQTF